MTMPRVLVSRAILLHEYEATDGMRGVEKFPMAHPVGVNISTELCAGLYV